MAELGFDNLTWIILCSVALLAGFIDAMAGGGGLLTVPAMLTAGLPPHLALGTNKLASSFGSAIASWTFYKKQLFSPRFWKRSFYATLIGAVAGTIVVHYISTEWLEKIIPAFIVFSALYTLLVHPKPNENHHLPKVTKTLHAKQIGQGGALGFYDGLAGPGTGAFWTVSNMLLYRMDIMLCYGLARSMNFVSNFCSLLAFIVLGHVHFLLGLAMGLCLMTGAYLGAHSAIRLGSRYIRPVFVVIVLIISVRLIYKSWF